MLPLNDQERYSVYVVAKVRIIFHITTLFNKKNINSTNSSNPTN